MTTERSLAMRVAGYATMIVVLLIVALPLYWVIVTSIKTGDMIYVRPPAWTPDPITLDPYRRVLSQVPFLDYFRNSLIITGILTVSKIVLGILCAYAFVFLRFPGAADGALEGAGEPGTVVFWTNHPGDSRAAEEQMISDVEDAQSDLSVQLITAGSNYEEIGQRLNAALAGGDLPDVVVVSDVTWFNFALNDQLAPMNDLWEEVGVDIDDYVEALVGDYELDGRNYGMPYARSTPLFYYNQEVFAEAGLPDRGPENWDEFLEWAPRLQEVMGDDGYAIAMYDGSNYLDWTAANLVWNLGGAYSREWEATFTDPGTIAAMEYLKQLDDEGYLVVSADSITEFGAGIAACAAASTGSLTSARTNATFDFNTAFMPGAQDDNSCPTGGAGLAIPAGISDERKVAAMRFIHEITSTQNTAYFAQETGYMPVRTSAAAAQEIQQYLEEVPQAQTAIDQLEYTRPQDNARVFVPNGGQRIGGAMDRILAGDPIEDVMEELQDEVQGVIDTDLAPKLDG